MQIHFADGVILQMMFSAEEYPSNDFWSLILTSFKLYIACNIPAHKHFSFLFNSISNFNERLQNVTGK